ncbi:M48 family metallopeptidase [Beijerinckia indica]|uniref:YgjP-like metallopeptidase domain-containing protein n=1 Tax=Beijerinckia indica subsp. indica (strain ATCC 9039 / DSM 1715 / NCIMB 8712) TaxID=395963 RepID=B2IJM9_BEII9|nr:SprT family zinc-dependent metalloprotease [Beijerinckia indica]ACB94901.1 protein of unknown function DUF45 [Beijerinckia indica subsp. indica ATCC 9039]
MLRLFRRPKTATVDPDFLDVGHAGESLRILLKRSPGARRMTLRVRSASRDVVLTMPAQGAVQDARIFAERHVAWIQARLSRLPTLVPFLPGSVVPLRDVPHLILARDERHKGPVWLDTLPYAAEGALGALCVSGEAAHHARRVRDFLMREARRDLEAAVERHAVNLGTRPSKISLRDTTSRWGSCSAKGGLNFSWRLILAPPYVLDYLAAHEVAHLRHMNHSDAFWRLVAELSPDVDVAEAWLKTRGSGLMRYGER